MAFTVLNFIALLFLSNLLVFHIMLQFRGLSTFEYLKKGKNKIESKTVVKVEIEQEKSSL